MLFSAHVVDTGALTALRRKTPKADEVPGLRSARVAVCGPFSPGLVPRPQLSREAIVACWEDEASLDAFLQDSPTGQVFAEGWGVRMELFRAVGVWPGVDDDLVAVAKQTPMPTSGPTVAITIGTFYLKSFFGFLRANKGPEGQFLEAPGAVWGTGFSNPLQRLVGTLSVWEDAKAATDYMRTDAHRQVVKDHFDPAKDPTGHTFVTGGGFFGFRPIATSGSLDGKNPVSAEMVGLDT